MEFMDTENILLKERNLIYEPDAEVSEDESDIMIYKKKEEEEILPAAFCFEPQRIRISNGNKPFLSVFLGISAIIGFFCGFIFCGNFFDIPLAENINGFLKGRINSGFFSNASVSFFSMGIWVAFGFLSGLSCISQAVILLLPAVKCIGGGIAMASFIKLYGAVDGILSFCAFVLPSFAMGTLITLYICKCAVKASNRLFLYMSGKNTDARPREFYTGYLTKGLIALAGCFIGGIIDAVITFICSNFFVI